MMGTIAMNVMTVMGYIRWNGWGGRMGKLGMGHHNTRIGRPAVLGTKMVAYRQL